MGGAGGEGGVGGAAHPVRRAFASFRCMQPRQGVAGCPANLSAKPTKGFGLTLLAARVKASARR